MIPNTTIILTSDRGKKVTILNHMKDFYLKRGYSSFKENIIKKKFNFTFLKKIKILTKLIFNSNFIQIIS